MHFDKLYKIQYYDSDLLVEFFSIFILFYYYYLFF